MYVKLCCDLDRGTGVGVMYVRTGRSNISMETTKVYQKFQCITPQSLNHWILKRIKKSGAQLQLSIIEVEEIV